jgi:outer membrane protein assembly factor BamB
MIALFRGIHGAVWGYETSTMNSEAPLPSSPTRRRGRPWFPIIVSVLAAVTVVVLLTMPNLDWNIAQAVIMLTVLLGLVLNLLWFLLSPRFRWRVRGLAVLALILLAGGFKALVKVDGTLNGTGMPRFVLKGGDQDRADLKTPVAAEPVTTVQADPRLAEARDVPQFFGPAGDGVVNGAKLARDWNNYPPRELWRQPIGAGWSAFAVVGGRALTQEQRGEDELVSCYELLSGKLLWAHADKTRFSQWQSGDGPHGTPAVADGRVYTYGGTGLLNCLDLTTGKLIWQRNVLTENKLSNLEWGVSSSPLLVDDKVVVNGGRTKGPVLFAYLRETGAPVWQGGDDTANYSSPALATLAGRRVILCNHLRALAAHDPATGAVVMEHAWGSDKMPKASQPTVIGGTRVFLSAGYGMGCQMIDVAAGPDGKLTATEAWSNLKMKNQFNSVALRGGHLYGLDDGKLACLDTATGERLWKDGRFGAGQTLLVDDLVIVQDEDGPVQLCAAQPDKFQELGSIPALSSKTWNHPVLAGLFLLVRNDREAVCYELTTVP